MMKEPTKKAGLVVASDPVAAAARLRQRVIGDRLRAMFDDVVNEPVPDAFLDILRRADSSAGSSNK